MTDTAAFNAKLATSESGGNYSATNSEGYFGKYQWGNARLTDYNRATGQSITRDQFLADPATQEAAQTWAVGDIDSKLGKFVGTVVNGIPVTIDALRAMAHLGGINGAARYVLSGGKYNPSDSNGTSLSDYAAKLGGAAGLEARSVASDAAPGPYPPALLNAYYSGRMTPTDQKAFESAVADSGTHMMPQSLLEAYKSGSLPSVDMDMVKAALVSGQLFVPSYTSQYLPATLAAEAASPAVPPKITGTEVPAQDVTRYTPGDITGQAMAPGMGMVGNAVAGIVGAGPSPTGQMFNQMATDAASQYGPTAGGFLKGLAGATSRPIGGIPGLPSVNQIGDVAQTVLGLGGAAISGVTGLVGDIAATTGLMAPGHANQMAGELNQMAMFAQPEMSGISGAAMLEGRALNRAANAPPAPMAAPPKALDYTAVSRAAASGDTAAQAKLAAASQVDPALTAAANRLGVELPPDIGLLNAKLDAQAKALRAKTGSDSAQSFADATKAVADRALGLIQSIGASTDISSISSRIKSSLEATQKGLGDKAQVLYDNVLSKIEPPGSSPVSVTAPNLANYLTNEITRLGGSDGLLPIEKKLMGMARAGEGDELAPTTYGRIDRERQLVGAAIRGKSSPYGDTTTGVLKQIYGALSEDQKAAAEAIGGPDARIALEAAQDTTALKKATEDSIVAGFGKDLDGSIAKTIQAAITNGVKGNSAGLNNILPIIPRGLRREAVAIGITSLVQTADKVGFDSEKFVNLYAGLLNNTPIMRDVSKALGPTASGVLNDFAQVARAIQKAKPAGKAADLSGLAADGVVYKLMHSTLAYNARRVGFSAGAAVVGNAVGGAAGAAAGAAVGVGIDMFMARVSTDRIAVLGKLVSSPEFKALVSEMTAKGKVTSSTVRAVTSSSRFAKWAEPMGIQNPEAWLYSTLGLSNIARDPQQGGQ